MTAPLTRVRQLIEQAASEDSEEAARSAAVQACRLIKKHGFVVEVASAGSRATPDAPERAQPPPPPNPHVETFKRVAAESLGGALGQAATGVIGDLLAGKIKRRR